jgi:parallel beta-helix repeat protein
MNLKHTLLTAALGLIMSALSAQSANIKISSLPFNITAPGTYVLTGNLTSSVTRTSTDTGAINISTAISGSVVVDLKGFTITGPGSNSFGVTIGSISSGVSNTYPITVRNGTIANFEYGVSAFTQPQTSDLTVNNIVFDVISTGTAVGYGINFGYVNSSTISNCTFNDATYGIADYSSAGGNRYNNNTFVNNVYPLIVEGGPITLTHCQFDGPPPN